MNPFEAGEQETVKAGVHVALGALAGVCLAYNAIAFVLRGERHLAINAVLYGSLAAYELEMVRHHRRQR